MSRETKYDRRPSDKTHSRTGRTADFDKCRSAAVHSRRRVHRRARCRCGGAGRTRRDRLAVLAGAVDRAGHDAGLFRARVADFGSNDKKGLRKAITMSVLLCAAVGILLTVVFVSSAGWLLHLLDTPENIYDGAHIYLTMMYAGTLITMRTTWQRRSSAHSETEKSAYCHVYCRMPEHCARSAVRIRFGWGIPGAAAATLLAQLFAFAYCVIALRKSRLRPSKSRTGSGHSVIRRLCHLGLPLALQHFVIVISGIIMQAVINTCGFVFLAGFTATNKLHGLMDCSASAFGYAASTYTGQNWGANRLDRVRMGVRSTLVLALSFSALLAAGMILFGRHVVALFISADAANAAEALSVAYDYLVVMSTFLLSAYVLHTYRSALQGMGFTTAPMLSGLTEFAGRVGASLLLTKAIGERGLFYTDAAAWTFAAVFLAASYYIQLLIIRKKGSDLSKHQVTKRGCKRCLQPLNL